MRCDEEEGSFGWLAGCFLIDLVDSGHVGMRRIKAAAAAAAAAGTEGRKASCTTHYYNGARGNSRL
jgi:hypothetical protein